LTGNPTAMRLESQSAGSRSHTSQHTLCFLHSIARWQQKSI